MPRMIMEKMLEREAPFDPGSLQLLGTYDVIVHQAIRQSHPIAARAAPRRSCQRFFPNAGGVACKL
jgi:hypothetical protein